jgi:hypothetical protein
MKVNMKRICGHTLLIANEETHNFGGHRKPKVTRFGTVHVKTQRGAPDDQMKSHAHRFFCEVESRSAENHKEEERTLSEGRRKVYR